MRKLVSLSLVALVAVLPACGDDGVDDCGSSCETPDSGSTESEAETSAESDESSDTTSTAPESETSASGGGSSTSETSAAGDSGTGGGESTVSETDGGGETTTVVELDSGVNTEVTPDGSTPDADTTQGDGGGGELTICEAVCAAAAIAECGDNSGCEGICALRNYSDPSCYPEVDAYLSCIGESTDSADFYCQGEDSPAYIGSGCSLDAWNTCMANLAM